MNVVTNLGDTTNKVDLEDKFCILYFDDSKTQEGSIFSCVLIYPERNKHFSLLG